MTCRSCLHFVLLLFIILSLFCGLWNIADYKYNDALFVKAVLTQSEAYLNDTIQRLAVQEKHLNITTMSSDSDTMKNATIALDKSGISRDWNITPPEDKKLILLWSPNEQEIMYSGNKKPFEKCQKFRSCDVTTDKSLIKEAKIVYFSGNVLHSSGLSWPKERSSDQLYVHRLGERPCAALDFVKYYDGKINLTMTYREDADLPTPTQHFEAFRNNTGEKYVPRIPLHQKTKSIVWPVSHCKAAPKRDDYARELSKYIDVDIYGRCGNLSDGCREHSVSRIECTRQFESEYKYYLSFENAICKDYITEKFNLPLSAELIPIVLGRGNYTAHGPPHSFINVKDYDSPKHLAEYLHTLSEDPDKYNSYFQWKMTHRIVNSPISQWCLLCGAAHDEKYSRPVRQNYKDWWFGGCDNELVDRMREKGGW